MPWQPAGSGSIAQDAQGNFHVLQGGAWIPAPRGSVAKDTQGTYHFNTDMANAPVTDPIGAANTAANAQEQGPVQDVINMLKAVPGGIGQMLEGIGKNATEHPLLGNIPALVDTFKKVAANPSGTLTSVSNAVQNATPEQVGRNVVAPLVAGGVAGEGAGAVNAARTAAAAEAATPAATLGLRTASGPGAALAGDTAGPTLAAQNQRVASTVLGADAGVPHTTPVTPSALADARVAPGQLLDTGYDLIPPGPLSPAARQQVLGARGPATITKPTPNVANQINDIESSLLDPNGQFTGPELRATRNSLNSDATAGADSADADTRAIAKYKRNVVGALDQHLADSLPSGAPITPDMVQNARSTLAKNYQLQDLIGKGGDINLQALAKLHRDSPDMLTGNTRTVAQFASDHPEVTGPILDADRISPPSLAGDLSSINILNPRSYVQPLFGALGRRMLRGPAGEAVGAGMQAPVAGLGGEFNPLPLSDLSPPPGQVGNAPIQRGLPLEQGSGQVTNPTGGLTASAPNVPPPAVAGNPSDIPLADLLSHGVEQRPAPGLSVGPMGSQPAGEGIPFSRNAAHEAGGLSLAPDDQPLGKTFNNSDLAAVQSQGVPEGAMTRTAPRPTPEPVEGGGLVFRSPNGQTIVRKRGNQLQVSASLTKQSAQGAGEGTQRMVDAFNFARANGLRLVSDTKVSNAAAKVYDRLEQMGYDITRNPVEPDGKGNIISTAGRPAFEVSGPPDELFDALKSGTGG